MAEKYTKAQNDALEALGNPKVLKDYDDGSLDIEFEGVTLAMGTNGKVMSPSEYMKNVYSSWKAKEKSKKPKKEESKGATTYSWAPLSKTPCERTPELCKPRNIKHVAWDADDTIWEIKPYAIASNINGPLRLVDPDTVVEETTVGKPYQSSFPSTYKYPSSAKYGKRYGYKGYYPPEEEEFADEELDAFDKIIDELTDDLSESQKSFLWEKPAESIIPKKEPEEKRVITIKLMPGYRDLLDSLKEQGITNSIISLNTEGTVKRIINKFGLTDHFLDIRDSWKNKGEVFREQMRDFGYKAKEGMFVDNTQSHVEEVAKSGAVPLVYGKDIKDVAQIVNYMTNG